MARRDMIRKDTMILGYNDVGISSACHIIITDVLPSHFVHISFFSSEGFTVFWSRIRIKILSFRPDTAVSQMFLQGLLTQWALYVQEVVPFLCSNLLYKSGNLDTQYDDINQQEKNKNRHIVPYCMYCCWNDICIICVNHTQH